jgi:hypothetical protein
MGELLFGQRHGSEKIADNPSAASRGGGFVIRWQTGSIGKYKYTCGTLAR